MLDMWKGVPSNVRLDTTHQVIKLMSNKKEKKTISLYGLLNKLFKRNFLCKINFFCQIDFLQSFFSHGTKSFAKNLCNLPWEKKLCKNRKIPSNWRNFQQIGNFLVNLTKNCGFSFNLAKMFFNFTGKLAKLFVPWEKNLCKLQIFVEFI